MIETITVQKTAIVRKKISSISGVIQDGDKFHPWVFRVMQDHGNQTTFYYHSEKEANRDRLKALRDLRRP